MKNYFCARYESNSYVNINEKIKLIASFNDEKILWSSLDPDVATVKCGIVTGKSKGTARIIASTMDIDFPFYVTVLDGHELKITKELIKNHYSNALTVYNLGIDSGIPDYYYDVVSSVNNYLPQDLKIDNTYHDKLPLNVKNNGLMETIEFICVHYTGNPHFGADADNNCSYFNNLEYAASIHFVTGRTNLYRDWNEDDYCAFAGLNEKYAGWHASDTKQGPHKWIKTGIKADGIENPIVSINENSCFTINGKDTHVKIPEREDGLIITGPTFIYEGKTCQSINKQGIATKIIDGEYYIGNTWWGRQQFGQTLCNVGGNYNSIGIESCIDIGSNLWHTWQITAKLVAHLLVKYNLSFDRVLGHHAFSGKDCPQPLLENDKQLWNVFMEMVKLEYNLLTEYKDYKIQLEIIVGKEASTKRGLLVQDEDTHSILYKINILKGEDIVDAVMLNTIVESNLEYDGTRIKPSLQQQKYEIK